MQNKLFCKKSKKEYELIIFALISFITFSIWCYLFLKNTDGIQRNIFFGDKNDWFMDFYNTVYYSIGKTPYTWGWIPARNYLPLSYLILYPFSKLYSYDVQDRNTAYASRYDQILSVGFVAFTIISFAFLFYILYKKINGKESKKLAFIFSLFLSGVTIFNIDRANELILATAFLFCFLITYESDSKIIRYFGLFCLAFSAVMKIFTAVVGIVLLYKKKYKDILVLAIFTLILTFLPFFWLEGSIEENIKLFIQALKEHSKVYQNGDLGLFAPNIFKNFKPEFNTVISYSIGFLALISAFFIKNEFKQIMLISLVALLISGQQGYYCIVYLFYPMALFFNERYNKYDFIWITAFLILLTPLQYDFKFGIFNLTPYRVQNTVLILAYFILITEGLVICFYYFKKRLTNQNMSNIICS